MFIFFIAYTAPLEIIDQYIPAHIEFLIEQYGLGHFQLSGLKVPRTGGVILTTVEGRAELDRILGQDPFYRERLANYEVTEFVPTKSSPAFAFLVESQAHGRFATAVQVAVKNLRGPTTGKSGCCCMEAQI